MPKHKSSLAIQIAELESYVPKEFDPEDGKHQSEDGSGSEESEDEFAGTEHYAVVGKSKLRQPEEAALGPKYAGSRVTREDLMNSEDDEEDDEEEDDDEDDDEDEDAEDDAIESDSESEEGELAGPFAELDEVDIGQGVGVDDEDGEIDSDAAFGDSDDEKFKDFSFRGSGRPRDANARVKKRATASDFMSDSDEKGSLRDDISEQEETDEDILDTDAQHHDEDNDENDDSEDIEMEGGAPVRRNDEDEDEESDESSNISSESEGDAEEEESEDAEEDKARRDELRKLMGEEQQTVVALSQAAKADAAKGNAVKAQRKAFDSLLHTRMDLQKALISTNSIPAIEEKDLEATNLPYEGAEEAAIKLWNILDGLRNELLKASSTKAGQKRKRGIEIATSSSKIWDRMQATEAAFIDNRQTTLDKWSTKVRGTDAQPISRKLNPTAPQQSLTSLLQDQLFNSDHLVQRTKIPRSCAPVQRDAKIAEDSNIYDDGPFYQLLLKELVDQRRVESLANGGADPGQALQWTAVKEIKTRKNVDTKASKGRKMRYNIHEKIQNFMAPEDRGSWENDAVDRFFGALLGQKMTLTEDDAREGEDISPEEEGLMLFRS